MVKKEKENKIEILIINKVKLIIIKITIIIIITA